MSKVYLSLGSNLGNKKENLEHAINLLKENEYINLTKLSSLYQTKPVGYLNQDDFYNIVAEIDTTFKPFELLKLCQSIENKLKRKRIIRWGPRTIDIDILLFENYNSIDKKLTIPHPQMEKRAFVIVPLFELYEDIIINGKHIKNIIEKLNTDEIIKITK